MLKSGGTVYATHRRSDGLWAGPYLNSRPQGPLASRISYLTILVLAFSADLQGLGLFFYNMTGRFLTVGHRPRPPCKDIGGC